MKIVARIALILLSAALLAAFATADGQDAPAPLTLTLAGYAVPREAYGDIIPLFQAYWLKQTGQQVNILESYQASGAQSRAVAGGFEADIVALSVEPDLTRLVDAGLVSDKWKENNPYQGFVTDSLVILTVRPGNPKDILDWADLAKDGVEVITPDPATSGGAQWNILAAYGAARRGFVEGYEANDDGATQFLGALTKNIKVLDGDGRASFLTFERGVGDAAITYENEYYAGIIAGGQYDIVYPTSTILIENPVAVVDTYVDKHGTREVAEAFVQFLWSADAQQVFANHGFRPVNPAIRAAYGLEESSAEPTLDPATVEKPTVEINTNVTFPAVKDEFTIAEFNGWKEARALLFGDEGLFTQLIAQKSG